MNERLTEDLVRENLDEKKYTCPDCGRKHNNAHGDMTADFYYAGHPEEEKLWPCWEHKRPVPHSKY